MQTVLKLQKTGFLLSNRQASKHRKRKRSPSDPAFPLHGEDLAQARGSSGSIDVDNHSQGLELRFPPCISSFLLNISPDIHQYLYVDLEVGQGQSKPCGLP